MGDDDRAPLLTSTNWGGDWPKSIKFIVWNEFCERFTFYGLKTILALFLLEHLHLSETTSTEFVHLFIVLSYATPLLGAILSDGVIGRYRTILYISIIYSIGNFVLTSAAAIPDTESGSNALALWVTATGLVLIASGTGGIKPCVAAFGGDQIELTLPEGPVKEKLKRQFFSMYYFAVNAGAVISTILTPVLRARATYAIAFSVPTALMVVAILIFWSGRKYYVDCPLEGNVFAQVGGIFVDAVKFQTISKKEAATDNAEEEEGILRGNEVAVIGNVGHGSTRMKWLDAAKQTQGNTPVEDVKTLLGVLIVLLPTPLFWSLADQQSSKWVFQATRLNGKVPSWLGGFVIQPDQMQALNPVLVLAMIPIFDQLIYPTLEKIGFSLKPIRRMWMGIALSAVAFVLSGFLQIAMDANPAPASEFDTGITQVSILWQIPQYILVTAGEILFSITGLEFAYSEAPDSMKSIVQAVWLFSVSGGNLVTIIIVAAIGDSLSQTNEYFFFAFLALLAVLVMMWLSSSFTYKHQTVHPEDTHSH